MSQATTQTGRRSRRSVDSAIASDTPPRRRVAPVYLLALLLISFFAWAPLLYPGYFQLHTGFQPVLNLADLTSSEEFVRWMPPLDPGAGLFQSSGPLAYWLAWMLQPLLGSIGAIKAVFGLSIVLGGLGMFWWTRRVAGSDADSSPEVSARAGLLAAVVFMLWPLLLVNMYVAGAFGQGLFIGLLPWAFGAITTARLRLDRIAGEASDIGEFSPLPRILAVVMMATLLVFADPALGLVAFPLLLIWTIWPPASLAARLTATISLLVGAIWAVDLLWILGSGAGVTASLTKLDMERFLSLSVHPYQLLSPLWGSGISTPDWKDNFPYQLGLAALGLAVLTVAFGYSSRRAQVDAADESDNKPARSGSWSAILFAAIFAAILVFMTTTLARPLWRLVPQLASPLNQPVTLLALVAPLMALLAGLVVHVERRLATVPVWAGIVALTVLSSYGYLAPRTTQVEPDLAVATVFGNGKVSLLRAEVTPGASPNLVQGGESANDASVPEADLGDDVTASDVLTLTVVWQPLQLLDFDYNVFIHGFDAEGNRIAQWDGQPQRNGQEDPVTNWQVGEIISGEYVLRPDGGRPVSDIKSVWIGLYNWQNGERLAVNGDDKVILNLDPPPVAEVSP